MSVKTVVAYLAALKFIPDLFLTNKILENFNDFVFSNDDIAFANADSDNVTFLVRKWVLLL